MLSSSNLQFINIGKYGGLYTDTADFSRLPRPYFNIGMILKGNAVFYAENSDPVSVSAGEIIVIPTGSVYVSHWFGNPDISYITFHFILEKELDKIYKIQKVSGVERLKGKFEFAYEKFADPSYSFNVLEIFYGVLSEVYPHIIKSPPKRINTSVKQAINYLTSNYKKETTVAELSDKVSLSPSRFFAVFKNETGMTPMAYKNRVRIQNAEKLLLGSEMSVEEISEKLGFNSVSYFRRTFKKYVGKTPRDYRGNLDLNFKL